MALFYLKGVLMENTGKIENTENLPSTVVNEVIVTGRKKRRLIDKAAKLWQRISYWTKACDVEFDDGKTAQEKVGNINGITSDFKIHDESISASSVLTHSAYNRFNEFTDNGRIRKIIIGKDGKPYIEYKDGADTVLKKLGEPEITERIYNLDTNGQAAATNGTINIGKGHKAVYIVSVSGKFGNSIGVGNYADGSFITNYNSSSGIVTWRISIPMFGGFVKLAIIDY